MKKKIIMEAIETGILIGLEVASVNAGTVNAAGGVKVGRRVEVGLVLNCASRVGSIVDVAGGAGVGGGSTILNVPGETATSGE